VYRLQGLALKLNARNISPTNAKTTASAINGLLNEVVNSDFEPSIGPGASKKKLHEAKKTTIASTIRAIPIRRRDLVLLKICALGKTSSNTNFTTFIVCPSCNPFKRQDGRDSQTNPSFNLGHCRKSCASHQEVDLCERNPKVAGREWSIRIPLNAICR
jgi:hypothetical protein